MKRPVQPYARPLNAEAPDHEGRGQGHRSANRTVRILSLVGPLVFLLGIVIALASIAVFHQVDGRVVAGLLVLAAGAGIDRLADNLRARS